MDFYEAVNKRRSIRQFRDQEISKEILERILDAGLKAPSSNHQRRWELVVRSCADRPSVSLPHYGAQNAPAGNV